MPRTAQQFSEMKEARRDSILDASLIAFSLYGSKLTIDDVASLAKCSHGIVYHYFKNVDEIQSKLLASNLYGKMQKEVIKPYNGIYAKDAIKSIVLYLVSVSTLKEVCYANIIVSNRDKKSLFALVSELVYRGQKEGDITGGNPSDIVLCAFYLLKGYYSEYLLKNSKDVTKPSVDNVMEIFRKKR